MNPHQHATPRIAPHFDLANDTAYQNWRQQKLNSYPLKPEQIVINLTRPEPPNTEQKQQMCALLQQFNMLIYQIDPDTLVDQDINAHKQFVRVLGKVFGLERLDHNECADSDAITALQVKHEGLHEYYIPYSNKAINWHTDGYYNELDAQIRGLILHCVRPAREGGENQLLDPEIAYILLRDQNPDIIDALSQPDALLIPKNIINGKEVRPDRPGPVFMFDPSGNLHMRYTARLRNAIWSNKPLVQKGKALLRDMMQDNLYILRATLQPGQGLLARNVLHTRSRFDNPDASERLLLRARYFDPVLCDNQDEF